MTQQPEPRLDLTWTFGDRIRKARREARLSQQEFAALIGCNLKSLSAWEADINYPRNAVAIAKRLELALHVPAAWVLGLETAQAPDESGPDGGASAPRPGLEPGTLWFPVAEDDAA